MLRILGKVSSINVRKVLWTCADLNISFEREDWGVGFRPTDTSEFLLLNPNGLVPVIKDDNLVLWESNAIIRYLASQYNGEALYPSDYASRARIDQWLDWQATALAPSWNYAFRSLVRKSQTHQQADEIAKSLASWTKQMSILERQLNATNAFVAGAHFSLADIAIGLSVNRWLNTPYEHSRFSAVSDYFVRLADRTGFGKYCQSDTP